MEADSVSPGEKAIVWPVTPVLLKIIYLRALQKYIGKRKNKSPVRTGKSVLPSDSSLETLPESVESGGNPKLKWKRNRSEIRGLA